MATHVAHKDNRGLWSISARTANDEWIDDFQAWVDDEFGGNESKAIKFAVNQAMQREEYSNE